VAFLNQRLRSRRWAALLSGVLLWLAPAVCAQQMRLQLEPAASQVTFTLDATLHTVHGTIKLEPGQMEFDSATGHLTGSIAADARSANTGNSGRDSNMHKNVLESDKYPEIVFVPSMVHGQVATPGVSKVELSGVIKLHGQEHEITVPAEIQISGNQWTATTSFAVPYVKWGLKNPSTFVLRVKDTVNVSIRAVGHVQISEN
jgi:polyisoprenoid-binding protein YceI